MKPLIVANWKMNPRTKEEAFDLAKKTEPCPKAETVICPPFCFLSSVGKEGLKKDIQGSGRSRLQLLFAYSSL
jgi:triosephosphate isomerase